MRETKTYDFGYAKVTIHPGKLSEEEFNALIKEASINFMKAVLRQKAKQQKESRFTNLSTEHPNQP